MKRKGMGTGKGKGYYNLAPLDSHIHSLSARGIKSATAFDLAEFMLQGDTNVWAKPQWLDAKKQKWDYWETEEDIRDKKGYVSIEQLHFQNPRTGEELIVEVYPNGHTKIFNVGYGEYVYEGRNWNEKLVELGVPKDLVVESLGIDFDAKGKKKYKRPYFRTPEGATRLKVLQKVTVPSTEYDKPIPQWKFQKRVDDVQKWLSKMYGGETTMTGDGGYVAKDGILIEEPVMVVTAFADTQKFNENKDVLVDQLKRWKNKWKQESVAYQYEDDLFFIE